RTERLRATDVASRSLREAKATIDELQGKVRPGANPAEISAALKQAQDALIAAQAVARLAQGDERTRLLAEVNRQRHEIDVLRGQVSHLAQPATDVIHQVTTTTAAPASRTTTTP